MKILLTGGGGFIGSVLSGVLSAKGHDTIATYRNNPVPNNGVKPLRVPDINGGTDWGDKLSGMDVVIHLAARAHVLGETAENPLEEFRKTNTQGTLHLAGCAARAGVKRFVFLSSIGVLGNASGAPFTEASPANPVEPYAQSKLEAEVGLRKIADNTGMEVVIVRPPLVYGPNCPGNFLALLGLIGRRLPLPLASVANRRSFVGVHNLADFLLHCAENPAAANQTFVIADEPDISTPGLIRSLAAGMGLSPFIFAMPYPILHKLASLAGKGMALEKLCGTLQVDSSFARKTLEWKQPVSLQQGLNDVAVWYASSQLKK